MGNNEQDLLKLDMDSLRRLQVDLLDKERLELQNKLFFTGKRIDHFERALRRKEVSYLDQDYESQLAKESRLYEHNRQQKISLAAARHKESLILKNRLQRILPDYQSYRGVITEKQSEEFQMRQHEAHTALKSEKAKRQAAYDRYVEEERRRREEEEREAAREEEKRQREQEEERRKEEAERKEAEEKARILEEERLAKQRERDEQRRYPLYVTVCMQLILICLFRKQDEMAEKQRQREREAEEKIAKRKQQALTGSSPSPGLTTSTNAWRPRPRQGDQLEADSARHPAPRWANSNTPERSPSRDRIARADGSPRAGSPAQAPPAPGRYVPPGKRSAQ
jgi:translation initiation factor 3 subunit A